MEVSLAILKGCQMHKDVKVDSNPFVIGRCRTANFIIAHVNVSRNHCHIVRENFLWKVNDYSSSGTYVNDELVGKKQSRTLNSGDMIRFGPIESNLCWTFYPLNEFVNDLEQCKGLLETNTIKDHKKDLSKTKEYLNGKLFHMETNCEGDETNKVHQEHLKEAESRVSTTSDGSSSLKHNENNFESNGKNCVKTITQPKKCENEIADCKLHESKYIVEAEIFQNKNVDVEFQQNSNLVKGKVKLKAKICENQSNITGKKSSLQKEDLQNKSFELKENEKSEIKTFSRKLNVMERSSKNLPQEPIETRLIKEPCFSENLLEKDQEENIHNQKLLYFSKKARIETETDVKHEMEQSRPEKTEELMKELEQLKSALSDLKYKNSALEGELAAASNCKNEALQLKSNLLENLADLMEDELQCTICSELFVQAITLSCTHTFCKFCINQWRKKQKTCPICRKKITNETRSLVVDNYIDKMVGNLSLELKERREVIIAERNESPHQKKVKLRKAKVSNLR